MLATHLKYVVSATYGPLTLVSVAPTGEGASISANLVATYNQAIAEGTGILRVMDGTGAILEVDIADPSGAAVSLVGAKLTLNPDTDFAYYTKYMVVSPEGYVTAATDALKLSPEIAMGAWTFQTADDPENPHGPFDLHITSYSPTGTEVSVHSDLDITFDASVLLGDSPRLSVLNAAGAYATINLASPSPHVLEVAGTRATVHLYGGLEVSTTYSVTLSAGAFKTAEDAVHEEIGPGEWMFTTAATDPDTSDPVDPTPDPDDPANYWEAPSATPLQTMTFQYPKAMAFSGNGEYFAVWVAAPRAAALSIYKLNAETNAYGLLQEIAGTSIDGYGVTRPRLWLSADGSQLILCAARTNVTVPTTQGYLVFFERSGDTFNEVDRVTRAYCSRVDFSVTQGGERLVSLWTIINSGGYYRHNLVETYAYDFDTEEWDVFATSDTNTSFQNAIHGTLCILGSNIVWADNWWDAIFHPYTFYDDFVVGRAGAPAMLQYWRMGADGTLPADIDNEAPFVAQYLSGNNGFLFGNSAATGGNAAKFKLFNVNKWVSSDNLTDWPGKSWDLSASAFGTSFSRMNIVMHRVSGISVVSRNKDGVDVGEASFALGGINDLIDMIVVSEDGQSLAVLAYLGGTYARRLYAVRRKT